MELNIKDWRTDRIIFSYECENNTYKKTVEAAVKQDISLKYAYLEDADLSEANLNGADLRFAFFFNADLTNANLSKADLNGADLRFSKLGNANLSDANLSHAKLHDALLCNADLSFSNLYYADLSHAHLSNTDLRFSNLNNADLNNADLNGAKIYYPINIPDGEFIAWKKVRDYTRKYSYIIKLKILADSKRSRATTDKCRCDKALVLEIQDVEGNKLDITEITNNTFIPCTYKVGEIVEADSWDENRFNECSHGIHFFLDREMAVNY